MKKLIAVFALSAALIGCQESESDKKDNKATGGQIAEQDKMSYGLGQSMAQNALQIGTDLPDMGINLDAVKQGFNDQLAEKASLTEEERLNQFKIFQQKLRAASQQKMQKDQQDAIANNKAYFENLDKEGGYTKTESGIYYKVINPAKKDAVKPAPTDSVKVAYKGSLTDGKVFDSSDDFRFSLGGGVIRGWLEGVKLMEVGSKYHFVIPHELAYGPRGNQVIPPFATLHFDIELLEILDPAVEKAKQDAELAKMQAAQLKAAQEAKAKKDSDDKK